MKIHFIGIGGIGVSALAQYYLQKGDSVSGSDLTSSDIVEKLKEMGAKISIGKHNPENLPEDAEVVIYSPAVQPDNPELKKARTLGKAGISNKLSNNIRIMSYPEALGKLTEKYFTIAVSGTHGKSTVTSMISLVLIRAGFDPTVILGTKLKEFNNSNFRQGESKYLVIEADEWKASFLKYSPKIIVLTNIEREHLDYYKNLNHILNTYQKYLSRLPEDGFLIANKEDRNIKNLIKKFITRPGLPIVRNIIYFSKNELDGKKLKKILKIPGEHNVLNALAVLKVARVLKIPDETTFRSLSEYKGSWRRFEKKEGKINDLSCLIISDYGHHPTEVLATLKGAREEFGNKKIFLVFQPHQYQRTFYLFNDFVKIFKKAIEGGKTKKLADKIIITDIFDVPGRENQTIKKKVNSKKLVKAINNPRAIYLPKTEIMGYLKKSLKGGEIIIIMGAGDIYKLAEQF